MAEIEEREARTAAAIDEVNADDPESVDFDGESVSLQLTLGRLAASWVDRLDPTATPAQRLAARAHHLRRWETPRSDYPEGRSGYLRWRTAAKKRHAEEVAGILGEQGWDDNTVEAVQRLIRKEGLGRDPSTQVHEDAVCLAFFEAQLDAAAETMGDKTVEVLRKTIRKMSDDAIARLDELDLSNAGRQALRAAQAETENDVTAP